MLRLFRRLNYWIHHRREVAELREEMEFHRAMNGDARGFGNPTLAREAARAVWIWPWLESVIQDLRYGLRGWRRSPVFTLIAILSLALGIGATTAVFSVVYSLFLRPLPGVRNPGELVQFIDLEEYETVSAAFYDAFRTRNDVITSAFVAEGVTEVWMSRPGAAPKAGRLIATQEVSGPFFETLGTPIVLGRSFSEDESRTGAPVAVISFRFWQVEFASDPEVIGESLLVSGQTLTIIGVAPRGFRGPQAASRPDLWRLREPAPALIFGVSINVITDQFRLRMLARLRPGLGLEQAQAAADVVYRQLVGQSLVPDRTIRVRSAATGWHMARAAFSQPLAVLSMAVFLVLLIACTNVGSMLLARDQVRRRELALRLSIGAARSRLVRQLLTECSLLAVAGGTIGVTVALWGTRLLVSSRLLTGLEDVARQIGPDPRILGFAAACSVVSVVLLGVTPAFVLTRVDPDSVVRQSRHLLAGGARTPLGRFLVMAQVAIALGLVIAAGLLLGTLANLDDVKTGFDEEHTVFFNVGREPWARSLPNPMADRQSVRALEDELARIPGITSVAHMTGTGVLLSSSANSGPFRADANTPPDEATRCFYTFVGPGFFETMGIEIVDGREFLPDEQEDVAVINESLADRVFPGVDPIGHNVYNFDERKIVGVVDDTKVESLREEPGCMLYRPMDVGSQFVAATDIDPESVKAAVVEAVEDFDDTLGVDDMRTFREVVDDTLVRERLVSRLTNGFAVMALLLASVGIYATLSYGVARRAKEIGVRMALGGRVRDVVVLFLAEAGWMIGAGVALGCGVALLTTRLLASLLYGLRPTDPGTFAAAVLVLVGTAALAAWLPARRAARVAPSVALRAE